MKSYRFLIPIVALLLGVVPALAAVTTTITFDGVPAGVVCGETWQENDVNLKFVPTTAEDCTEGACFFGIEPGDVWLYPCRLDVDFEQTYEITRVEIDWTDWCGVGCTKAFLYDGAATVASVGNTVVSGMETVNLIPSGGVCDRIGISSCEGQVFEIRIIADTVPDLERSWGTLKAIYR